jgi:LPXTG-motif cell wall-anchored protein
VDLLPTTVNAVNGDPISAALVESTVVLNGTVNVVQTDIFACNGVIHVIDAVLLPPADEPEVPATGSNSTIALLGGALIAVGALFTAATRRRAVTA